MPNLEELNLSSNLISSWNEFARILQLIPSLQILNISRSRLIVPNTKNCPTVVGLKCLVLNSCKIKFKEVCLQTKCHAMFATIFHFLQPVFLLFLLKVCGSNWIQALILANHLPDLRILQLLGNSIQHFSGASGDCIHLGALNHIEVSGFSSCFCTCSHGFGSCMLHGKVITMP